MKFQVNYERESPERRELLYISDEYSFTTEPYVSEIDFDIALNQLLLTVVDSKVIQVSGFCPYGSWIQTSFNAPSSAKGALIVLDNLEPGFSYRLNQNDWPVYVNPATGWVCIGSSETLGESVEFIHNGVAVIHQDQLVSLWIKPRSLPEKHYRLQRS